MLTGLFYPWGFVLQAVALVHFVRRRPDTYWLWIILIGGAIGALVYIVAEVLPDLNLLVGSLNRFTRRRRIRELEAIVVDNPAVGNQEELADLYLEEGKFAKADALFKSATDISTLSETYYNYASFLATCQRTSEAREWAQRILAKKPTMPRYLRRRERPWFRKASALLKRLR